MKTVAGIDLGTQSLKVFVYDYEAKKEVASCAHPIDIISENDGTREQKAEWYTEALKICFDGIPADVKSTIQAMGVSGHQHGFVPLDADRKPLYNVKLWNDTSTVAECAQLTKAAGGDEGVIAECSNLMLPGFTAPKILWLKNHKPEAFEKLQYILLPHDFLNLVLTGSYVMEWGDTSGTALFNGKTGNWSKKLCDAIDPRVMTILPKLIKSWEPAGMVSAETAEWLGIPAGIPVSSGGGDNMMGAIGTGTVEDGFLTMSMGTSGTLYGYSDAAIADPVNGLSGFCSSTGGYLPLLCTMNCTVVTEEVRALFDLGVKDFDAQAEKAPIGAEGVVVLPFFNGERTPNLPHGKASITGLTLANTNRPNICRAAMESAVFAMRAGIDSFKKLGFSPKEIRLIGGGSKSPLWRDIVANVMNVPVKLPVSKEAAALGAAVQALWCLEMSATGTVDAATAKAAIAKLCAEHVIVDQEHVVNPVAEKAAAYDAAYAEYQKLVGTVSPLYK